jgi:hypothetical protein
VRPTSGVQLRELIVQSPAPGTASAAKPSLTRGVRKEDRRVVEVIRSTKRADVTF